MSLCFFFFNDTATTEIYTLSLHDALPISAARSAPPSLRAGKRRRRRTPLGEVPPTGPAVLATFAIRTAVLARRVRRCQHGDRKSTRLNSSHANISYAVFCLKKKKQNI